MNLSLVTLSRIHVTTTWHKALESDFFHMWYLTLNPFSWLSLLKSFIVFLKSSKTFYMILI